MPPDPPERDLLTAYLTPVAPPFRSRDADHLSDARERQVPITVAGVRVRTMGSGPAVVLVHGWSGTSDQLGPLASALVDAGYCTIIPDMPGHGRTAPLEPDGTASLGQFATTLVALAADRDLRDAVGPLAGVIGHSGGALAAAMALSDGMDIARFVGVGMLPRLRESVDRFLAHHNATSAERASFDAATERRFDESVWTRTNAYVAASTSAADSVLLIHDVDDEQVPVEEARLLAAHWVGARLIETSRYGHHLILRRSNVFADIIDFLESQ